MIFSGDVAIADGVSFEFLDFPDHLKNSPWCINLEGAIGSIDDLSNGWGCYNSTAWVQSFNGFKLGPLFIANNHIHDIEGGVEKTLKLASGAGLECFGAGLNVDKAKRRVSCASNGVEYHLIGCGWPVIGCQAADNRAPGVNTLEGNRVRELAKEAIGKHPSDRTVVVIHGNYEFERYPQPAHRKLAFQLIDLGVYAVIFHHPHVVGPVERYKGRTIAYSLGNWAFSYGEFFSGKLKFPQSSFHQIAIELGLDGDVLHHAKFIPPNTVEYQRAENIGDDAMSLVPEFEGYTHDEYIIWFKKNRIKRKLLPIYQDADSSLFNSMRDCWIKGRQILIDAATKAGVKSYRRRG
ncbi:CapA family protein [Halomonas sp. JS92-SW72]|uniref:CapA family protein n=1 Tax=Halomonas sp. JS92-SW72 TaxID=2306583 RepID=UPI000E5A4E7F|nr:CapA family protein [Halomonas sp. JS92-SW72]AXY43696.1 CapA family protein [Halomonas sp. JS92-SW72]